MLADQDQINTNEWAQTIIAGEGNTETDADEAVKAATLKI